MTERQIKWERVEVHLRIAVLALIEAEYHWPGGSADRDAAKLRQITREVNEMKQTAGFLKTHLEIADEPAEPTAADEQLLKENGQS